MNVIIGKAFANQNLALKNLGEKFSRFNEYVYDKNILEVKMFQTYHNYNP
jgi:hypothetical protein